MKNLLNKLFVFSSNNGWYESYQNHRTSGSCSCSCRGYCPRNSDLLQVRDNVTATSFPGFSPTRPYGARERETGRGENLGTRLMSQVIRESERAYSVIRGNQRPNVSKYVRSVSNGFLYALEAGLVNLELL